MRVAKLFRWEAAHRLPWHEGDCKNLHGHSYRMTVAVEGDPDGRGMLLDFKHLGRILKPLVNAWDHATLIAESDTALRELIAPTGWKHVVLPFDTTCENLCDYVAAYVLREAEPVLRAHGIRSVQVRISETESSYAEAERRVPVASGDGAVAGAAAHLPEANA